jgi:hypothetical protein
MSVMGNEFSGLPLADLIGGPLNAACSAQIRLAKATSDFITTVGFNPDPVLGSDGKPVLGSDGKPIIKLIPRQVDFSFWQPIPIDPAAKADTTTNATTTVQKVVLSVPFLAIVNVPALMVKSVDIVFDMEVKTSESHHDDESKEASLDATVKVGWGPFSAEVKIHGAISAHQENTRSTDRSAKYHVQVHASDDGMPEGLSRVLDILQKAIAPVSISKATDLASANVGQNQKPV